MTAVEKISVSGKIYNCPHCGVKVNPNRSTATRFWCINCKHGNHKFEGNKPYVVPKALRAGEGVSYNNNTKNNKLHIQPKVRQPTERTDIKTQEQVRKRIERVGRQRKTR